MAYAIVRTDLMQGTKDPSALVSVKLYDALQNGSVVLPTTAMLESPSTFQTGTVKANTPLGEVALLATPELMYEAGSHDLGSFVNEAGSIARGYRFRSGNIFSVTEEALDGVGGGGKIVELQNGNKLKVVSTLTAGSTQVGTIIGQEQLGGTRFYVIRVV